MFRFLVLIFLFTTVYSKSFDLKIANQRIQHGESADISDFPYIVSILANEAGVFERHHCGGTIVDESTILTSAHCIFKWKGNSKKFRIRAGSTSHQIGGQVRNVRKIICHEDYIDHEFYPDYDIAVIFLSIPLSLSVQNNTAMVSLPKQGDNVTDNSPAIIAGWGRTTEIGDMVNNLRLAYTSTMNQDECIKSYDDKKVTDNMICARSNNHTGTCHGDSGGPLIVNGIQVGITSWGPPCLQVFNLPAASTRVAMFIDWIAQTISENKINN